MKRIEAENIVRGMLLGAQKACSIADENGVTKMEQSLGVSLEPWLRGDRDCRPILMDAVDRIDNGESVEPLDLMNLLYIAKSTPSIGLCALNFGYTIPRLGTDIEISEIFGPWS